MTVSDSSELDALRHIGRIVARTLVAMRDAAVPGTTTAELDAFGAELLARAGARSAPRHCYGFPGDTCISVAPAIAHGIPGAQVLEAGMLVNVDVSAEKDGWFADTGASFVVGVASADGMEASDGAPSSDRSDRSGSVGAARTRTPESGPLAKHAAESPMPADVSTEFRGGALPPSVRSLLSLCRQGREALDVGIATVLADRPFRDVGRAIEDFTRRRDLTLIRNLASHGVGRSLHEEPDAIPTWFDPAENRTIVEGQVFTLEPFVSRGAHWAVDGPDEWTLLANAPVPTVQFEHTLVATHEGAEILTLPD